MFGPQDIVAMLAGAALLFGGGGAAVRAAFPRPPQPGEPHAAAEGTPERDDGGDAVR